MWGLGPVGVSSARPVTVEGDGTYKQNSFPRLPSARLRVCPVSIQQFQGVSPTGVQPSHVPESTGQRNVPEILARLPEMGEKNPATRFPARLSSSGGREPPHSLPLQVHLTQWTGRDSKPSPCIGSYQTTSNFSSRLPFAPIGGPTNRPIDPRRSVLILHSAFRNPHSARLPVPVSPALRLSGSPVLRFSGSAAPHLGHTSPDQSGPQRIFDL